MAAIRTLGSGGVRVVSIRLIMVALAFWVAPALAQTVNPALWVTNGRVLAIVPEGNTIYIGGAFSWVGPATGGGVPLSAATGELVQPFPEVLGTVYATTPDGAGGWYIGGRFSAVGGVPRSNLAHILADGSVAPWAPSVNDLVLALAVSGSTVYIGGYFTSVGGQTRNYIAALDATTGAATAWDPSAGSRWPCFVTALAVSGSTVYVGGWFTTIGGQTRNRIAALDATTGAATAWNPNANSYLNVLAVSGNVVYVGGAFDSIGGRARNHIAALDATTGIATAWKPDANGIVSDLAVSGSVVYAGGSFGTIGAQARNYIAALDATTGAPTDWDPNPSASVRCLAVSGSTVYVGGDFGSIGGQARNYIAALDATTGTATAWNPNASGPVNVLAVSGSTVYAGGSFTGIGGQTRNCIAALDATTGAATAWNPNANGSNGSVGDLAVSGGTLYAGGAFWSIGGQARSYIAALDTTTGSATAWNPNASGPVSVLAVSGGTVYVGGQFTSIGGQARNNIAALDAATGTATAWNPNANGLVTALAVSGNTVYAGGQFTRIGGQARNNVAALDAMTGTATAWDPNAGSSYSVYVMVLAVSGSTVYAGGWFTSIGGQARNYVAALDATTGTASTWNPNVNDWVYALAVSGSTVYAGGDFTGIGGEPRSCLAAISSDIPTPVLVSLASAEGFPDRVELAWQVGGSGVVRVSIQRRETTGDWLDLGTAMPDGTGRIVFTDHDVISGHRYGYRLGYVEDGSGVFAGETWVEVPAAFVLALHGGQPNPSDGRPSASFTLPSAQPATLELLDVTGRRLVAREVGALGAGTHVVDVTPGHPLVPGLYWLRLTQGGRTLTAKTAVVR